MPEEVEEKASWLLKKLQAECCEQGAWVENKGIVLALHHEAWKEKGSIGKIMISNLTFFRFCIHFQIQRRRRGCFLGQEN